MSIEVAGWILMLTILAIVGTICHFLIQWFESKTYPLRPPFRAALFIILVVGMMDGTMSGLLALARFAA